MPFQALLPGGEKSCNTFSRLAHYIQCVCDTNVYYVLAALCQRQWGCVCVTRPHNYSFGEFYYFQTETQQDQVNYPGLYSE